MARFRIFWGAQTSAAEEETPVIAGLESDAGNFWRKRKKRRRTRRLLITRTVPQQVEEVVSELVDSVDLPDVRPFLEAFYPQTQQVEAERLEAKELAEIALREQRAEEERRAREAIEEADRQYRELLAKISEAIRQASLARRRKLRMIIAVVLNEDD